MLETYEILILFFAIGFCFLMTWGVGANDLANVMSPTMGSKAITVKQALVIAMCFELLGAFFGGSGVTETLRDGIIDISTLDHNPILMMQGMLALLMAGTIWMNLASYFGLPVSITNAIVGSMVGLGVTVFGWQTIHWQQVGFIALSWITSPVIAGLLAYLLISSIQILIFGKKDPMRSADMFMPLYMFMSGLVLSFITVIKGLAHFEIEPSLKFKMMIMTVFGFIFVIIGTKLIQNIKDHPQKHKRKIMFHLIEKQFAILVGLTTCAMVFAHGSNDISITIGPLSTIYTLATHHAKEFEFTSYPSWIILLGCFGVMCGLFFHGRKVIETVGSSITALTPSRAFAATIAASTTVVVSTSTGIPVSATQTLVGAILGVGLARGIGALNLIVIRNIFMSWIITLPVSSLLTIACYHALKPLFRWMIP